MFKWTHMRRALIPVLPYAGQSLIGGAYIFSFTTYFFQQAGLSNPFAANMVVTFVGFAGNCLSMLLFDRVGRRPLLIWGTVGAAITNLLIGGLAFLPITPSVGAGLITVTALWVFNYSVTYSTVGQYDSPHQRHLGLSGIDLRMDCACRAFHASPPLQSCGGSFRCPRRCQDSLELHGPSDAIGSKSRVGGEGRSFIQF